MIKYGFYVIYKAMSEGYKRRDKSNSAFFSVLTLSLALFAAIYVSLIAIENLLTINILKTWVHFGLMGIIFVLNYLGFIRTGLYLKIEQDCYKNKTVQNKHYTYGLLFYIGLMSYIAGVAILAILL